MQTHLFACFGDLFARGLRLMRDATGVTGGLRRQTLVSGLYRATWEELRSSVPRAASIPTIRERRAKSIS